MKRVLSILFAIFATTMLFANGAKEATPAGSAAQGPVKILWWSHWANEPAKKQVIEAIKNDYMVANPNVEIELVWWDKNPLANAWVTAMTAGSGAPDIVTDPAQQSVEQIKAGWFLELGEKFPWNNFYPEVVTYGNDYPGVTGKYRYHISRTLNMILYNKEIFAELGIKVPADYTFTQDQFLDIIKKANAKGYAGVANAIGNRNYPATYIVEDALLGKVGGAEWSKLRSGKVSWDRPDVRDVLEYSTKLRDAGFWPASFSSMGIDEFHVYFHTQKKAAMLMVPTWYTGRAFKSVDQGGQSPDFKFGMLRYPKMNDGKGNGMVIAGFESGYMISSATKYPDICRDILAFASQPKYGALWATVTNSPSAIKYEPKDVPSNADKSWAWYHEEMNKVYGSLPSVILNADVMTGAWNDAVKTVLNEGLPLKLLGVDEAVKKLDSAVGK